MPIYLYHCGKCGDDQEVYQRYGAEAPGCCDSPMVKVFQPPALIKVKSDTGTPVLSKGYKEGYTKEYQRSLGIET